MKWRKTLFINVVIVLLVLGISGCATDVINSCPTVKCPDVVRPMPEDGNESGSYNMLGLLHECRTAYEAFKNFEWCITGDKVRCKT